MLEELELCSSPPRIRNGLPSTISWVALPLFSRWGREIGLDTFWAQIRRQPSRHNPETCSSRCRGIFIFMTVPNPGFHHEDAEKIGPSDHRIIGPSEQPLIFR